MSRKQSREFAMQLLFQMGLCGSDHREDQLELAFEESERSYSDKDKAYIEDIVNGVFDNLAEIDGIIEDNARGWKLSRLAKTDLSILRLCIYEVRYREDIPFTVSVNEAVELAKKYGTEDSGAFINGILSKVAPMGESPPAESDRGESPPAESDRGESPVGN